MGRTLYPSASESGTEYCTTDCHFLCGISPSFVLSEENDSIETRLGAAIFELLVLGLTARVSLVCGSLCSNFGEGGIDFGGGLLRLLSLPVLGSLLFFLSRSTATAGVSRGECSCCTSFDGLGATTSDLDDDLRLCRDEDALDEALVEEATDDRDGLASRRERLSMALIASVLDAFDRDMSDS